MKQDVKHFHDYHIGILYHPNKPASIVLSEEIETFLHEHGHTKTWRESAWAVGEADYQLPEDASLLITLGGDGTLLRAARLGAASGIPMLGVKMGRLGFLAEILPEDWQVPLLNVLEGNYWIEERMMVRARVERPVKEVDGEASDSAQLIKSAAVDKDGTEPTSNSAAVDVRTEVLCEYDALNDVVLSRGDLARIVRISVELDGGYLTKYTCDGLIVSTATGSTGYALAVGGPVLPPELHNILVIPIAPHLSMDRAVVLSQGSEVRMMVYSDHDAMLTVDGQVVVAVEDGDQVVVTGSPHSARFIRLRESSYFYQSLMEKLQWTT